MKPAFTLRDIKVEGYTEPVDMNNFLPDRVVFSFLTEGEALCEIDGNSYLLGAGQLFIVPEDKSIRVKYFNKFHGFAGTFSLDFLKDASYPVLRSSKPHIQSFWFDDAVFMGNLLRRMLTAVEDKDWGFLQSAMDLILCQIRATGKVAAIPEKFLNMVFDAVRPPVGVAEYAVELGVTPNYLNKTVKQHTHRTAIDWIGIARINLAKQLLKDRSVPIGDVAGLVGLPDQSYFARFFKKKTGLTPSDFRNQ